MRRSSKSGSVSTMTGSSNRNRDFTHNDNDVSRRHWVLSRTLPEIRTRDGRCLDPDQDTFLITVAREGDRGLLRIVKDIPMSPHVVNYRDVNGVTPLICVCFRGDFILVKMLCEIKGIDVNLPDNEGNTPLIIASQGGHSSVVAFLLDKYKDELDINRRNIFGFTAVMKAALTGRVKCLRSLLAAGANMHLRDPNKGFTALEWAEFCGRRQCVDVIRSYAKPISRGKRLSQAWNDTESWLKSLKIGGHNNNSKTSAASVLCTSVPLLTGHPAVDGDPDARKTRNLIIPSIYITHELSSPEETVTY